jgi:hypothetical protein
MPKFPGAVQHNNPVEAILSLPENQVKGLGVFADLTARNALNANMRSEGFIAVVTGLDKVYIYTAVSILDADWQSTANWTEIGSGTAYVLPTASGSILGGIKVGTNLSIDGNGILSATDTNTTYTAGSGLTLTGASFSHADTSAQTSSTNTGRTYIQSIGLDTYGHVTSLSTATETVTSNTYTAGNGLTLTGNDFNVGGTTNRITVTVDAIDIASTYVGQASITTLGTITTGTWNGTSIAIANGGTGATTALGARANLGLTIDTDVQAFDADLKAIAGLTGTNGLLRKDAANSWFLDTSVYITGNQTITISGDVTGSGTTAITTALSTTGVTAGTYNNSATSVTPFTVDAKGRITGTGTAVTITPSFSSITSKPTTLSGYGILDGQPLDADLTAIAALTGTGILKRTAADTWSLDTTTYANDNAVVKSVNSVTPISGAVTLYGTSIARSSSNVQTINAGLVSAENNISTNSQDIAAIQAAIAPISKDQTKSRFGFSQTSASIETTETTGSFFRGSTGYFFSQASPGTVEIKVLDDSATPVQRTVIYGEGRVNGAQVGVHNTSPAYPFDITGNTRVTGNIIVTGTVDGVDISELKNTVDNLTLGGTEEIELFSYFIS